jgi:peptidoglycan/xylan/chitin deacetylase (PgdA/CDA1 family)
MRGVGRLRQVARRITNVLVPRAIILLYHRVVELPSDPQLLCVSPKHFAEHLQVLRKHGPIHLKSLSQTLHERKRRCNVIVTFDDGYADNLYNAQPLLQRFDVAATVFVTTGYIGSQREFWQDELEKVFLQPTTLPQVLRLNVNGRFYEWDLGDVARYREDLYQCYRDWNVSRQDDPTLRQQLYRLLCQMLEALPGNKPQETMGDLLSWAGIKRFARPTHRTLLPEELIRLADGGLVEVASHTENHPVLSSLPVRAQNDEIVKSKARLEEIIGQSVTSFAYPYGRRSDYTNETVAAVRDAGFHSACSNFPGSVRRDSDLWQLPRFLVRNWNGEEFADSLRQWLTQ